jgi:hypothetical protein
MIYAVMLFTVFSIGSALAPNWPALIVFRLFVGISGVCPAVVVAGMCNRPKFYASELTLVGYVRTRTTIPKVAGELWHYSWLLLLLALYWVPGISGFISTVA